MQIGAIVTLAGRRINELKPWAVLSGPSRMTVEVLGRSLLDRTIDRVQQICTSAPTVISEGGSANQISPSRSAKGKSFIADWECAVGNQMERGIELLMLVRMSAYTNLDFEELLQFHLKNDNALTQAYDSNGPLDIAVVNANLLRGADGTYRKALSTLIPQQRRFVFSGDVNRLRSPHDFWTLVEDGLNGRCSLQPVGIEVQSQVWIGQDAQVDSSAAITAPAFIGAGSRISWNCVISGTSAIERNCEIDCASTVNQSHVLQDTYVGVGLDLHRSIVASNKLFHLGRNIELDFADDCLIGAATKTTASVGLGSQSLRPNAT